jgi:deoxyadenosine/deoxycytidine kinase
MKIAITGSHSTGKTTLCEQLTKLYPDLYYIKETAREQIAKFGKLPQDMTTKERCKFQEAVLDSQIEQELLHDDFIADRSVFDVLAYSQDLPSYKALYKKAIRHYDLNSYDHLFYIPIEFELENDGTRPLHLKYQKLIDIRIQDYLRWFKLLHEMFKLTGTVEQRIQCFQIIVDNS